MLRLPSVAAAILTCCTTAGCTLLGAAYQPSPTGPFEPPKSPPPVFGPLSLSIVYPPTDGESASGGESLTLAAKEDFVFQSRDSAFVFGAVGRADASVKVNGVTASVHPSGGWIAWFPRSADSTQRIDVVASCGGDTAQISLVVPVVLRYVPPDSAAWIDTTSFAPTGDRWLSEGEGLTLSLRAAPGARVRGITSDGAEIRFFPDTTPARRYWGEMAFSTHARAGALPMDRYVAWWSGRLGPDPDLVMAPNLWPAASDTMWMTVEAVVGLDTARSRWPLRVGVVPSGEPILVAVNDDPTFSGLTDGILPGRPVPYGTYHWFFPNETVARVSGRWNDQVRLQLSRTSSAWVNRSELYPLPPGTPPPTGVAGSMRLMPGPRSVVLRIPMSGRVPFRVDEDHKSLSMRLYGVAADMDWIHYGESDPLIELVAFSQPASDEVVVDITLTERLWGYRTRWSGNDLLLEIRRPPLINPKRPLEGRVIAIDAGHPPGGSTGPTGTRESTVNLQVARKTAELLEQYGAVAVQIRESSDPVGLYERIWSAEDAGAELLVSVHANALPDGVNPFTNNGTVVYYFHPSSADLARELSVALVRQLGYRDLGIGRGDLALVRSTWMPSALAEGLFLMVPEHEAVLMSEEGQWRYARGLVEGVASFLRQSAADHN